MKKDLTQGSVIMTMLSFAGPMILGNLLQQCYNIADTLIVGRFLGAGALAAVGSAYTLMTFLTSILIRQPPAASQLLHLALTPHASSKDSRRQAFPAVRHR